MDAKKFVAALSEVSLEAVFNPYRDRCDLHDLADGPAVRRRNLRSYLAAVQALGADTIWMGRDLGYRGGRRTGLALTDEQNLGTLARSYPGAVLSKATRGPIVAERTAAEIWSMLDRLEHRPLLWNVFPLHPHEPGDPMTNRKFTRAELHSVTQLNRELIEWLRIRRIICIGQDAGIYASDLGVEVQCVRHPSYGGVREFRAGIEAIYAKQIRLNQSDQSSLF